MNEVIKNYAREREGIHEDHASSRPLSEDYEFVGMAGEFAFAELVGIAPDLTVKTNGDGGIDFKVPVEVTIDVKTARKALNLIIEAGKPFQAQIYVLAEFNDNTGKAQCVGWAQRADVAKAPTREFGHGILNHYIAAAELRPMSELVKKVGRIAFG